MRRIFVILCFAALCMALGMSADSFREADVTMVSMRGEVTDGYA